MEGGGKERGTRMLRSPRGVPSKHLSSAAERMKNTRRCWQKESGWHVDVCGRGPPGLGRGRRIASLLFKSECQGIRAHAILSVSRCQLDFLPKFDIALRNMRDIAMTP